MYRIAIKNLKIQMQSLLLHLKDKLELITRPRHYVMTLLRARDLRSTLRTLLYAVSYKVLSRVELCVPII